MADSSSLDALVFDLDDTLYPERDFAESALREVAERFAEVLGPADAAHARMCALLDSDERGRVFNTILTECGRGDADVLVPQMIAVYRAHRPALVPYPDAAAALTRWVDRVPLGMVTDGPVGLQQRKIDALGIAERFSAIVITGQWGGAYYKPHRRGFDEVAERLGLTSGRCAYVADNVTKDFVAPRHLGGRAVHVSRQAGLYAGRPVAPGGEPDVTIDTLDALDSVLQA